MWWVDWVEAILPVAVVLRAGYLIGLVRHIRQSAERRPDYAKIAQLELELGISQPDPPPPPKAAAPPPQGDAPVGWDPDGFGVSTHGARRQYPRYNWLK
jgi:hypothetical protein